MKKVISSILALVMVFAVVATIPMTASAAETLSTSRYFASDSTTGLDAFYGTPDFINQIGTEFGTINGKENYTLKDSTWDNALKVTFNPQTMDVVANSGIGANNDYDILILWDNDNLYILQDTRKLYTVPSGQTDKTIEDIKTTTKSLGIWDNSTMSTINVEHSYYQILLPREMTDLSDAGKRPKAYAVASIPCLADDAVASYSIYEGVSRVRDFDYASDTGVTSDKTMLAWADTYAAGIRTFVERLTADDSGNTTSYRTATVIPWTAIDSTPDDAFANLTKEQKAGQIIGVWIFNNGAKHIYHNGMSVSGVTGNTNDTAGFDTVTLYESKDDVTVKDDYYVDLITPDFDYWLSTEKDTDGQNKGQFTKLVKNDSGEYVEGSYLYERGGQTYEINNAAQLLALAQILEAGTNTNIVPMDLPGIASSNKADKALLSRNNVFKLTADIDLNPGVTDWDKVNDYYVKKNSGELADIDNVGSPLPANIFYGFDRFYGILDGQGHSIIGLFNPDTKAVSWRSAGITNATGGLIGQLSQGGITNLYVESGYVGTSTLQGNVMFGGLIGEIRPEAYTDFSKGNIIIANILVGSDFVVHRWGTATDSSNYAYGGIASSIWAGTKTVLPTEQTIKTEFSNIVFAGTMLDNAANTAKNWSTDLVLANNFGATNTTWKANNISFNITYKDVMSNASASTYDGVVTKSRYTIVTRDADGRANILEAKEGYLVHITDGTAVPHKVADMLSDIKWQATVAADGKFSIRFVAETESIKWQKIGFNVLLSDGTTRLDYRNVSNTVVYTSILAAGEEKTADDLDIIDGDYLYVFVIDDLDASKTYTATIRTYFTDVNGNLYESVIDRTITDIVPWDGN